METEQKNDAIRLKSEGKSAEEIGQILGVHPRTVYKWCAGSAKIKPTVEPEDVAQTLPEALDQIEAATYHAIALLRKAGGDKSSADYLRLVRALGGITQLKKALPDNDEFDRHSPEAEAELNRQIIELVESWP